MTVTDIAEAMVTGNLTKIKQDTETAVYFLCFFLLSGFPVMYYSFAASFFFTTSIRQTLLQSVAGYTVSPT